MNKKQSRNLATIAAVALTAVTLTGCSTLTYEEAQASEHRIVQTGYDMVGGYSWSYYGPSGDEVPLTEDCREQAIFAPFCNGSADGSIQFHFVIAKHGALVHESIIVNSEQFEADCASPQPVVALTYVCAPVPQD